MKILQRISPRILLCITAIVSIVVTGCGGRESTGPDPQTVASIVVDPASDTLLAIGHTQQLTATAKTATGATVQGKTFTWISSAPEIVSVHPTSGVATAIAGGEALISAAVDGKSGEAAILVAQLITTVQVTPPTAGLLAVGATQQFSAVAKDANGGVVSGIAFLWISSDPSVATVDNNGKATAKGPGSVTISAAGLGVPGAAVLTVTQNVTQLAFSAQPASATEGLPLGGAVQIEIRDDNGALVTSARNLVTLTLNTNASGGTLAGAVSANAVAGIATFTGLSIDRAGSGYTLSATATGLAPTTSTAFNVFLRFVSVSAGQSYTCGVTASGEAWCWGRNFAGQVGDGTTGTNRLLPAKVLVPAGVRFVSISASGGGNTTCGISTSNATYCWGFGTAGELGNGVIANVSTPTLTVPPAGVVFSAVAVGQNHVCAVSISGTGYCWGQNLNHQLGDGSTTSRIFPTPVTMPAAQTFATVGATGFASCATTPLGSAYCWGGGAIGDGSALERFIPTLVNAPGITFSSVYTTGGIACGLTFSGTARCWGDNTDGAVGDGTNITRLSPVPVVMPPATTFSQITVGSFHVCAVAPNGTAYCWGFGLQGALGNGGSANVLAPLSVTTPAGVTWTAISAAINHTCAVTSLGAVYCWGLNSSGQLGDGTTTPRSLPVRVQR